MTIRSVRKIIVRSADFRQFGVKSLRFALRAFPFDYCFYLRAFPLTTGESGLALH